MASAQRGKRSSSQPTYRERKGAGHAAQGGSAKSSGQSARKSGSAKTSGKHSVKSNKGGAAGRRTTANGRGNASKSRSSRNSKSNASGSSSRKRYATTSNAPALPTPLIAIVAIIVTVILFVWGATSCTATKTHKKQWEHDHYWQATVEAAEDYYGVDRSLTTAILTMIQVESDGNVNVDEHHDILQALEGDGRKILLKGIKKLGIKKNTPEASIYAGTYEFSLCIADFKTYMGRDPVPDDLNDVALLAQGYNYGHLGWFKWLKRNGIETWTLEASERYQAKIDGLGTATHGQKIMNTFPRIAEE